MITFQQVKAARALLNWSQNNLAKASGISMPAIARLELGTNSPRVDTLKAIETALRKNGIEFSEDLGVSLRHEVFKLDVYDGLTGLDRIWDDIMVTMAMRGGGEMLMSGKDEQVWADLYGDRLGKEIMRRRRLGITHRLLIAEGNKVCLGSADVYRCVPEELFGETHDFIYGDKYALINWGPPIKAVLMHNKNITDTFRRQFNFHWKLGKPVENPQVLYSIRN